MKYAEGTLCEVFQTIAFQNVAKIIKKTGHRTVSIYGGYTIYENTKRSRDLVQVAPPACCEKTFWWCSSLLGRSSDPLPTFWFAKYSMKRISSFSWEGILVFYEKALWFTMRRLSDLLAFYEKVMFCTSKSKPSALLWENVLVWYKKTFSLISTFWTYMRKRRSSSMKWPSDLPWEDIVVFMRDDHLSFFWKKFLSSMTGPL